MGVEGGEVRRAPIFFIAVILIMLVMSIAAFILAITVYLTQNTVEYMNIILSASAILLSIYLLLQMRRRTLGPSLEPLKVLTVIRCVGCNYESMREFERGDYILKEIGQCPKCNGTLYIHSIFREVKEKEKTY
ncbi:MAG: hypothetical protein QXH97_04565 [Candidatus Bathyarchaeia archaeon]